MRIWLSSPRILGGLVRPGVSFGREDGLRMLGHRRPARLPRWRRYELRHCLQEAAKARGEKMTKEEADYRIDKGLSTGRIDKDGTLVFTAKDFPANSSREQLIERLTKEIAALGLAMPRRIAEAKVDAALAAKADRRSDRIAGVIGLAVSATAALGVAVWIFRVLN
jgi:hypothetical protein